MKKEIINIALDGPSGSGKSTVADIIAKRLDILHLDTGAMYRALGLKCKLSNVDVNDEKSVENLLENFDLKIEFNNGKQVTVLDGKDVSSDIRVNEISMLASNVSKLKCVREKMVSMQREIANGMSCILDGRDIGTCVLKDAKYKFFVTATAKVRAERRYKELTGKGYFVDYNKILEEIKERDYNDSHRAISPLKKADDAVEIDTSTIDADTVAERILKYMEK